MKTFREYFIAHYFMRMSNGKFLIVEGAFIYMIIACAILAYGVLEFYNTWWIVPFLLPFAFGLYQFFAPKIKNISQLNGHWRTQLRLLADPRMNHVFNSSTDQIYERRLRARWEAEYGQKYDNLTFVALQKWQPVALVVIVLIVVWLWM